MTPVETDSGACSPTAKAVKASTWRWAKWVVAVSVLAVFIGTALFADYFLSGVSNGWLNTIACEVAAACRDPGTQWMIVLCLAVYAETFLVLEWRKGTTPHPAQLISQCAAPHPTSNSPHPSHRDTLSHPMGGGRLPGAEKKISPDEVERVVHSRAICAVFGGTDSARSARTETPQRGVPTILTSANFWLGAFLALILLLYAFDYKDATRSVDVPILLMGIVFGKAVAFWVRGRTEDRGKVPEGRMQKAEIRGQRSEAASQKSKVRNTERPLTPALSPAPSGGEGVRRTGEGALGSVKTPAYSPHDPGTRREDGGAPKGAADLQSAGSRIRRMQFGSTLLRRLSNRTGRMPVPLPGSEPARRTLIVIVVLLALLAVAALWRPETFANFQYHGVPRWAGAWNNPNIFGLLMGVGVVLGVGAGMSGVRYRVLGIRGQEPGVMCQVSSVRSSVRNPTSKVGTRSRGMENGKWWRLFCGSLCFLAAGVCGFGLYKSYSRGAWLGTALAFGYFAWHLGERSRPGCSSARPRAEHEDEQTDDTDRIVEHPPQTGRARSATPGAGALPIAQRSEVGGQWSVVSSPTVFRRNAVSLSVVLLSVVSLCFWQFRYSQWRPAQRIFSIANPNDFSWRNRVSAWSGAAQMMLDRPLAGFGWGQAETVYDKKYRAARLEETAAIQMNDFFMVAISAGIPAMICLGMYILLSLRGARAPRVPFSAPSRKIPGAIELSRNTEFTETPQVGSETPLQLAGEDACATAPSSIFAFPASLSSLCRAGALVPLVGFWFDGGLFKLAVAPVFWILLELGKIRHSTTGILPVRTETQPETHRQDACAPTKTRLRDGGGPRILRWLAWVLGIVAIVQTVVLLTIPFFPVQPATLAIARRWLVPPSARSNLAFAAESVDWRGRNLNALLDHVNLASYNRQLVSWRVDDSIYRQYVLMPTIAPERDGQLNWRRPLWEYFYPRIRRETDPRAAAETVSRKLNECVRVSEESSARSIEAIWRSRSADASGFQAMAVAALRSVGIPARLGTVGQAEIYVNGQWVPAPQPTP